MKYRNILLTITLLSVFTIAMSSREQESRPAPEPVKVSGKSLGYFQVGISMTESGSDAITLTAQVLANRPMENSEFQWKLPGNAEVLSGRESGEIDIKKGAQEELSIELSKDKVNEGDQVFLFVYKMVNGERHGVSHSYVFGSNNGREKQLRKQSAEQAPKYFE